MFACWKICVFSSSLVWSSQCNGIVWKWKCVWIQSWYDISKATKLTSHFQFVRVDVYIFYNKCAYVILRFRWERSSVFFIYRFIYRKCESVCALEVYFRCSLNVLLTTIEHRLHRNPCHWKCCLQSTENEPNRSKLHFIWLFLLPSLVVMFDFFLSSVVVAGPCVVVGFFFIWVFVIHLLNFGFELL